MVIGVGEQRNEIFLYRLLQLSSLVAYSVRPKDSFDLWHARLGHPSSFVVNKFIGTSSLNTKNYTICLHVKQTMDVFHLSKKNASETFDLIRCDLWSLYNVVSTCEEKYFLTILDDCFDLCGSICLSKTEKLLIF